MRDPGQLYFATNKELHDLLFSAKQKITEGVLHELLRDRGILCCPQESREVLIQLLSMLPHDYLDVVGILERREASRRNEKTSTITLNVSLTADELKAVVDGYRQEEVNENVQSYNKSSSEFVMNVTYSDYDYSRTRLLQRQDRDAAIEFAQVDGKTQIRIPATEKARSIIDKIKTRIESTKKQQLQTEEIELTALRSSAERTLFFTKLITSLSQFQLHTVSRVRVALSQPDPEDEDVELDDDGTSDSDAEAEAQMLGVVRNVALSGDNLVASPMYRDLTDKGFFITSITWRSRQTVNPYSIIECDAGFEEAQVGKKFRYAVHGALRLKAGKYTKNIRPVDEGEKAALLELIESTARKVLAGLVTDSLAAAAAAAEKEEEPVA